MLSVKMPNVQRIKNILNLLMDNGEGCIILNLLAAVKENIAVEVVLIFGV